jgi:hypothetical protein
MKSPAHVSGGAGARRLRLKALVVACILPRPETGDRDRPNKSSDKKAPSRGRSWIAALALGFFFLIVPIPAISDVGHVPSRVGFDVGRVGRSNWLADLLHKPMGVAFAKNIFVSNATKDDGLLWWNFDPLDSAALSARTYLISKFDPSVFWKFWEIGDLIDLAPSVTVFDNFARCLSVIVHVELKPFAWDSVDCARWWRREATFSYFFGPQLVWCLTTPASRHVSALDVFGAVKLFLGDIFSTHYQSAGRRIEKIGGNSDDDSKCSNEQSADRSNLLTITMDEIADLGDADTQRRFKGGIIVLLGACCALSLSILLLGLFNRQIPKPRRGADDKNNGN